MRLLTHNIAYHNLYLAYNIHTVIANTILIMNCTEINIKYKRRILT